MLPLSDLVLLKLQASPRRVRELATLLQTDTARMHRVVQGLARQGLVDVVHQDEARGATWGLAPGVRVTLIPARVEVSGGALSPPACEGECRAITDQGRSCRFEEAAGARCYRHTARAEDEEADQCPQ